MARTQEIPVDEALAYFALLGSWTKVARVMRRPRGPPHYQAKSIRQAVIRAKGRDAARVQHKQQH
jgi:hypothetical protein